MDLIAQRPEMSPAQASLRLRRIQRILAASNLDALLLVPGMDGNYNTGSSQCIGYLLKGCSSRDAIDNAHLGAALEDSVLCIRPWGVTIYANSVKTAESVMELLTRRCQSLEVFTPTPEEAADPDLEQECKIGSFVQMLRGTSTLGIPFVTPDTAEANLMVLEKWPLLTLYGLEGVGKPGFFTQNFKVSDMYAQLQSVYAQHDSRSLELLLHESSPILMQHWSEMLKVISQRIHLPSVLDVTERQVSEPLLGYFSYGMLRNAPGVVKSVTMPPRVIFGARTAIETSMPEPISLASAPGPQNGLPALHFIAEAADPRSPLRVARTYFLAQGALLENVFATPEEEAEEIYNYQAAADSYDPADAVFLMRLYTAMVDAAEAAMNHFTCQEGATSASAKACAMDVLGKRCTQLGVGSPAITQQSKFALWQCDHANRLQGSALRGSRQLKVVRLAVVDVLSPTSGGLLGGLVYADTFMEILSTPSADCPARLLNLTEGIPAQVNFSAMGTEGVATRRTAQKFSTVAAGAGSGKLTAEEQARDTESETAARVAKRADHQRKVTAAAARLQSARLKRQAKLEAGEALRNGDDDKGSEEEELEVELEDEGVEAAEELVSIGALEGISSHLIRGPRALGRMLTLGGGDDAVLLTGCPTMAAVAGTLWSFTRGLVFVTSHTHSIWVLHFGRQLEAITIQDLKQPDSSASSNALESLGEAVVLRGREAACGFAPATYLTTNVHVALPLAGMTQAGRKHMLSVVLPAWQRSCRESAALHELADEAGPSGGSITYVKDPFASNPFPASLYKRALHVTALQHEGGKRWVATHSTDAEVDAALDSMDDMEMVTSLGPLDPAVEALLMSQPQPSTPLAAITLVAGLPGAEQSSVAHALVDSILDARSKVQIISLPGDGSMVLNIGQVDTALQAALSSAQPCQHVVMVTSCFQGIVAQLRTLAATAAVKAGRAYLAGVVTCVSSDAMYEDKTRNRLLPALMDQLTEGFVDVAIVTGSTHGVHTVQSLIQARSPELPFVRGSRAALTRAREELHPAPADRLLKLQQQTEMRRWGYAQAAPPSIQTLVGPLGAVHIVFSGPLQIPKLREAVEKMGLRDGGSSVDVVHVPLHDSSAAPKGQPQYLVLVTGYAKLHAEGDSKGEAPKGAAPLQELVASRETGLRVWTSGYDELQVASGAPSCSGCSTTGGELFFFGTNLNVGLLANAVSGCGLGGLAPQALRTLVSLSVQERSAVAEAHKFDPLPEGCYFDGQRFFDAFGDVVKEHPSMPEFLEKFVEEENKRIQEANAAAAAATVPVTILKQQMF